MIELFNRLFSDIFMKMGEIAPIMPIILIISCIGIILLLIGLAYAIALMTRMQKMASKLDERLALQETWLLSAGEAPEGLIKQLNEQLRTQSGILTETAALITNDIHQSCQRMEEAGAQIEQRAIAGKQQNTLAAEVLEYNIKSMENLHQDMLAVHESLEGRIGKTMAVITAENANLGQTLKLVTDASQLMESNAGQLNQTITATFKQYDEVAQSLIQNRELLISGINQAILDQDQQAKNCETHLIALIDNLREIQKEVIEHAEHASSQIESQRLDLSATTAQARNGAESLGVLLENKLGMIQEANSKIHATADNTIERVQKLQGGLEKQIEILALQSNEIEQRLFSHSEDAILKLKENINGYVNAVAPIIEKAEVFALKLDQQSEHLANVELKASMQTEILEAITQKSISWQENLSGDIDRMTNLLHDMDSGREAVVVAMEASSTSLNNTSTQAVERAKQIGEYLTRHGQELLRIVQDVSAKLTTSGGDFAKQAGSLTAAASEAISGLDSFGDKLNSQSEKLTSSSVSAGMQFSDHQTMLENLTVKLNKITNETREMLGEAINEFKQSESLLINSQNQVMEGWGKLGSRLHLQIDEVSEINQHAEAQLNNISEGLSGQREWLQRTIEIADGGLNQLLEGMRDETSQLSEVVEHINQQVAQSVQSIQRQVKGLEVLGSNSLKNAISIKEQFEVESRDLFNRTSRHIIEDLNSISIDLTRALEGEVPEADWRRYIKGDRTIFSRTLLRNRQDALIQKIAERVRTDGSMRGYVGRYVELFEQLLQGAEKSDSENLLHATFLTSDVGKLYIILSKALGKDE